MDTLALVYTPPTTRACYGLSPIRLRPYWAHNKKDTTNIIASFLLFVEKISRTA